VCNFLSEETIEKLRLYLVLKVACILIICLNLLSAVDVLVCLV